MSKYFEEHHSLYPLRFEAITSQESGILVPRKAVINATTDKVVGVVGEKYQLIPNRELVEKFEKYLDETDVQYTKLSLETTGRMNQKFRAKYKFPSIKFSNGDVTLKSRKTVVDDVQMMVELFNSYDGSGTWGLKLGGYRLVCLNGLRVMEEMFRLANFHTAQAAEEFETRMIVDFQACKNLFNNNLTKNWTAMKNADFDRLRAYEILKALDLNKRYDDALTELFKVRQQAKSLETMWDFYNMITWFATHVVDQKNMALANQISASAQREILR